MTLWTWKIGKEPRDQEGGANGDENFEREWGVEGKHYYTTSQAGQDLQEYGSGVAKEAVWMYAGGVALRAGGAVLRAGGGLLRGFGNAIGSLWRRAPVATTMLRGLFAIASKTDDVVIGSVRDGRILKESLLSKEGGHRFLGMGPGESGFTLFRSESGEIVIRGSGMQRNQLTSREIAAIRRHYGL